MNVQSFLEHHGLTAHPFDAEEARLDPIFDRLINARITHPAFGKILGRIDQPATAIVFGEKGSGKTAIRLMMGAAIARHNDQHPDRRVLPIAYDDLNPLLDALLRHQKQDTEAVLENFRLEDHQDGILALGVTRLIDAALYPDAQEQKTDPIRLPEPIDKTLRKLPRQKKRDLAVLAALYDQPRTGSSVERFGRLRSKLRLRRRLPAAWFRYLATLLTILAVAAGVGKWIVAAEKEPLWLVPLIAVLIASAVLSWGWWAWLGGSLWARCRRTTRAMPGIARTVSELRHMLAQISPGELSRQPLPQPDESPQAVRDARYQLTRRFIDVLGELGYAGMIVLVDRVDEPTAISGEAERMKAVVWPMLDNKFLKQDRIGLKLLLPIELRHLLARESPQFFQEARLDKQNLIDRLQWSGTTLYDLCNRRIEACRATATVRPNAGETAGGDSSMGETSGGETSGAGFETSGAGFETSGGVETSGGGGGTSGGGTSGGGGETSGGGGMLLELFEPAVTRDLLVDALDQMHQPRDAFKFLYQVIQEHCQITGDDQDSYRIARLTLESVRRSQSQRVQDLHRGLSPS